MNKDPYKEYLINQEPSKEEKEFAWKTAIGLQKVDGLDVSEYLKEVAKKNIDGEITIYEANHLIDMYYEEKQTPIDDTLEADKVSSRITALLSNNSFTFSVDEYLNINKFLFFDIYKHAGEIRKYDITKKEWVLNNKSVIYGSYSSVLKEIEYDINEEKKYDYANLNTEHVIKHLSRFVSNLWQAHAFGEGNTRTTAVFLIKYLRKMEYNLNNDLFEKNAWYFRNSLVRANYADYDKGIKETTFYLELFLRNLLLKENNELKNRYLHIDYVDTRIGTQKPNIEIKKPDIDLTDFNFAAKTKENISLLYNKYYDMYFGRTNVIELLSLSPSRASEFLKQLLDNEIIEHVKGKGKGKYTFKQK